jgi:hypothetical protein
LPTIKSALQLLASCLIYSLIIAAATVVTILFITREPAQIVTFATYSLLIEGGSALVVGGAVANFSPVIGRIGASIVHSAPWDAKRIRESEKQARAWIVTGTLLFLFGLLASAF